MQRWIAWYHPLNPADPQIHVGDVGVSFPVKLERFVCFGDERNKIVINQILPVCSNV